MSKMTKGFNCSTCGRFHEFGMYVAAHWDERLIHTCDSCGSMHAVRQGNAREIKKGKVKRNANQ